MSTGKDTSGVKSRILRVDAAGLAVCALLATGAYFAGVEPVVNAQTEIEEKKRLIEEQTRNAADAEELVRIEQSRLEALDKQFKATKVQLSRATELNKRLDVVAQLLESHGLSVQAMDPGAPTTDPEFGKFVMVPIRLSGMGTFGGVSGFLHDLLANKYADVEVRALSLTSSGAAVQGGAVGGESGRSGNPSAPRAAQAAPPASYAMELRWYAEPAGSAGAAGER